MLWIPAVELARASVGASHVGLWRVDFDALSVDELCAWTESPASATDWVARFEVTSEALDTKWISPDSRGTEPPLGHSVPYESDTDDPGSDCLVISERESPDPIYRFELDRNWGGPIGAFVRLIRSRGRGVQTLNINHRAPLPKFAAEVIGRVATQLGYLQGRMEAPDLLVRMS